MDGVGGDAFVVGAAEAEAALGEVEVGEVGAGGGGGVGGLVGAAGYEGVEVGGEVDDGGVGRLLEEEAVAELFGGSAAEGDDDAALAEEGGEGGGLEVAEVGFAVFGEDFGDGAAVAGFDLAVEIEEAPAEALGEEGAGGGFAGAHEAGEDDAVNGVGFRGGRIGGGFGFGGHVERVRIAVVIVVSVGISVKQSLLGAKEKPQTLWAAARWMAWVLLGGIREAHNAAGPLGIPVAIAKSAGGGAQVHRDLMVARGGSCGKRRDGGCAVIGWLAACACRARYLEFVAEADRDDGVEPQG